MGNIYKIKLQERGLKNTRCRVDILSMLDGCDQPAGAEQIYERFKSTVSLSTVYRTLDTLCAAGLITRLNFDKNSMGKALYEYSRDVHRHHLICIGCHKVIQINYCPLGDYEATLADKTNYSITGHKLDMYGYCPDCKPSLSVPE